MPGQTHHQAPKNPDADNCGRREYAAATSHDFWSANVASEKWSLIEGLNKYGNHHLLRQRSGWAARKSKDVANK